MTTPHPTTMRRTRLTLLLAATAAPLAAHPAHAQPRAAPRDPVPRDTAALRAVVVTATRVPVLTAAPTASTTVLDGADLRARGIVSLADALREVPGFAVVQQGSQGGLASLFVRGGQSTYTKVLVDGVPANQPGGQLDLAFLSVDDVERIEVVRGPASVLYGSDAVSGVVQIFTRRGRGPATPRASLRGGSLGTVDADVGVSGAAAGGRASYALGVAHHVSAGTLGDTVVPGPAGATAVSNDFRNTVLSASGGVTPDARSELRAAVRWSDGAYHYPTDFAGRIDPLQDARRDDRRLVLSLDAGRRVTDRVELRLAGGASEMRFRSTNLPTGPADTTRFYSRSASDVFRRTADARVNVYLRPTDVLTAGVELSGQGEDTRGSSSFARGAATESRPFDETRRNAGYYAQWLGQLGGRFTYVASGRVDDNQRFGTFATGRLSAALALPSGTRLRAAAGNAFREPLFSETFSTAFSRGNPSLRPEESRSWEAAVEQTLTVAPLRGVTLGATWFDQRFREMIQFRSIPRGAPASDSVNYVNLAAATARGLELEARAPEIGGLTLGASYTWLRTRVVDPGASASIGFARDSALLRRPAHQAALVAGYRLGHLGTFALTTTYVGSRADQDFGAAGSPRLALAGYTKVDLSADVLVRRAGAGRAPALALTARVDNALDRRFEPVRRYPAPGAVVLLGARVGPR